MNRVRLLLVFASILATGTAHGQAVQSAEPSSTHIFPAGGRRGTVVPVRVGGECLTPGAEWPNYGATGSRTGDARSAGSAHTEPSAPRLPLDANFMDYPKVWDREMSISA